MKQPGCWSLDPSELSEPEDWSISVTDTLYIHIYSV